MCWQKGMLLLLALEGAAVTGSAITKRHNRGGVQHGTRLHKLFKQEEHMCDEINDDSIKLKCLSKRCQMWLMLAVLFPVWHQNIHSETAYLYGSPCFSFKIYTLVVVFVYQACSIHSPLLFILLVSHYGGLQEVALFLLLPVAISFYCYYLLFTTIYLLSFLIS